MNDIVDVAIPALGVAMTEASIVRWYVSVGQVVEVDDPLAEMETDKVVIDLAATAAGTITEILAEPGASVDVGATVVRIATSANAGVSSQASAPLSAPTPVQAPEPPEPRLQAKVQLEPIASPARIERHPHDEPPRVRFASVTGVSLAALPAVSPGTLPRSWTMTRQIAADGALARVAEERAEGDWRVSLSDVFVSAATRSLAEILPAASSTARLGVAAGSVWALPAIPSAATKTLSQLAVDRRAAVEAAWSAEPEAELPPGRVTLVIANVGKDGADVCVPPSFGPDTIVVGFGSAAPRVWRVGDGVGIRVTVSITITANVSALGPLSMGQFLDALTDKVERR